MIRTHFLSAILSSILILSGSVIAQESDKPPQPSSKSKELKQLVLDADGNLKGKVVAKVGDNEKPVEAKMTLIRGGVKVKTIFADEQGNFSFGNVPPGNYSVSGSAARFAAVQPVAVVPAAPKAAAPAAMAQDNSIVLGSPTYSSFAPAASYSYPASSGGGFVSGGGGRLLGGRRLLRLGLVGGIVAIAVSGDDDASPDN